MMWMWKSATKPRKDADMLNSGKSRTVTVYSIFEAVKLPCEGTANWKWRNVGFGLPRSPFLPLAGCWPCMRENQKKKLWLMLKYNRLRAVWAALTNLDIFWRSQRSIRNSNRRKTFLTSVCQLFHWTCWSIQMFFWLHPVSWNKKGDGEKWEKSENLPWEKFIWHILNLTLFTESFVLCLSIIQGCSHLK